MKVLVIGDIFGRPGRETTKKAIEALKDQHDIDLIIANGENLAHGAGMTKKTYREMLDAGVDYFTTGNHIYDNPDIFEELDKKSTKILAPANYPPGNIGKGYDIITVNKKKVLLINLMGRVFIDKDFDCPFRKIDEILEETKKEKLEAILIDLHAEATSEKIAFMHYVNGRASVLWGTHTHVPTADADISEEGLAYITDVGFTGPTAGVIGVKKENIINSFLKQGKFKMDVAEGPTVFNAVLVEIEGMKAKSIEQISLKYD